MIIIIITYNTGIFYMLRNYEMKDKIYCFVKITSAKYRIDYIVTGRNIAYRGIPFVPNETFNYNYFGLVRNALFGPDQYISF